MTLRKVIEANEKQSKKEKLMHALRVREVYMQASKKQAGDLKH